MGVFDETSVGLWMSETRPISSPHRPLKITQYLKPKLCNKIKNRIIAFVQQKDIK